MSDGIATTRDTGLTARMIAEITRVIGGNADRIILFGSRAKGNWREGSDIDLAVFGRDLDPNALSVWIEELEESLYPWSVDIVIVDETTDTALKEHIDRVGRPLLPARPDE